MLSCDHKLHSAPTDAKKKYIARSASRAFLPHQHHLTSRIPQSRVFRKSKLVDRPRDLTSHYSIIGIVLPSMPLAANTQGLHVREQGATHNKSTTLARLFWNGTAVVDW